jgi:hypothetical protein
MRFPVKPLCEQKRVRSDGTANIYFQYCYDAEHRTFLNSEIKISTTGVLGQKKDLH